MKWIWIFCFVGLSWAPCASRTEGNSTPANEDPESAVPSSACAAGCAAVPDEEGTLDHAQFLRLVEELGRGEFNSDNPALETLLFHGPRTREHLEHDASPSLDPWLLSQLETELAKDHARLELRVIDEQGATRLRLDPTVVPLAEKQHLHASEAIGFDAPEISGTIKRVGLRHLWARL